MNQPPQATAQPGRARPVPAALLMLLQPVVAALYLGLPRLAAALLLAVAGLHGLLWVVPARLAWIVSLVLSGIAAQVALAAWAVLRARRHPAPPRRPWRRWYGLLAAFLVCGVVSPLAWLPLPFAAFNTPSGSMEPTLQVGDLFLTERYDRPGAPPLRPGDLVVFPQPGHPDVRFVKRVVAIGGDTVRMRGGVLHVNGVPVRRERLADQPSTIAGTTVQVQTWRETLANGRSYLTLQFGRDGWMNNTEAYAVPPGEVFVIGDNRDNSMDSRAALSQFGPVPAAGVIGRAFVVYWGANRGRIGTTLDPATDE